MTKFDHSSPYKNPGSGGARNAPPSGGEDWWPLPEGSWETETRCEEVIVEREGLLGRLADAVLPPKTETHCETETQKRYF